jgi:protein TonB
LGKYVTFAAFSDGASVAAEPQRVSGLALWWADARESLRRRGGSAALVVLLHALLLLLLLRLAPPPETSDQPTRPTTVTLVPGEEAAPAEAPKPAAKPQPAGGGAPAKALKPPPVPLPVPKPQPSPEQPATEPIKLWAGMEKFNLAHVPSSGSGRSAGTPGASAGAGDAVVGTAPGGQPLYNAQWYRRPTSAELGAYLPPRMQNGWGMVACRTVADYRVEDCREVGQSPAGSGLSRAVRLAAWQFRVRPPRVGGKPLIGEWVRIRITWDEGLAQP